MTLYLENILILYDVIIRIVKSKKKNITQIYLISSSIIIYKSTFFYLISLQELR